jgi:hypothetical protein
VLATFLDLIMKHTYTAKAFINPEYESIERVKAGRSIPLLTTGEGDYFKGEGYVFIGEATVTIDLLDPNAIHENHLDALNAKLQVTRAENQKRENAVLDQISKLQALTFVEAA